MKAAIHPYAHAIVEHLKDQMVEVWCGDSQTGLKLADHDFDLKSIIVGTVRDAVGDCIILDVRGTRVFLNAWSVRTIVPWEDPLFLKDIYLDESFKSRRRS